LIDIVFPRPPPQDATEPETLGPEDGEKEKRQENYRRGGGEDL